MKSDYEIFKAMLAGRNVIFDKGFDDNNDDCIDLDFDQLIIRFIFDQDGQFLSVETA